MKTIVESTKTLENQTKQSKDCYNRLKFCSIYKCPTCSNLQILFLQLFFYVTSYHYQHTYFTWFHDSSLIFVCFKSHILIQDYRISVFHHQTSAGFHGKQKIISAINRASWFHPPCRRQRGQFSVRKDVNSDCLSAMKIA